MDRLNELITKGVENLEPDELAELLELAAEQAQLLASDPSAENLEALRVISEAAKAARAENQARTEAEAARIAEASELLAGVTGEIAAKDTEEDPATEDPDPAGGEEDPPVEDPATTEDPAEEVEVDVKVPVAVAASAKRPARRPAMRLAPTGEGASGWKVHDGVTGMVAGSTLRGGLDDVAVAFERRLRTLSGKGNDERVYIATRHTETPRDRMLTDDVKHNRSLLASAISPTAITRYMAEGGSPQAITASGGLCAPLQPRYDTVSEASTARPIRDALPQFGVTRGGVSVLPPFTALGQAGAIGLHTVANDESGATKSCLSLDCSDPTDYTLEAIYSCVTVGNFNARAWPEGIKGLLEATEAAGAKFAELRLLTGIDATGPNVTSFTVLGTARDVLAHLNRYAAQVRNRYRLPLDFPMRAIFPGWLKDQIRDDLMRQLPGDSTMAVADAEINAYFAARNINMTWTLDSSQDFGTQGSGPMIGWPSTVVGFMFHEGAWLLGDGGTLDLGLVRDSVLNGTNDFQIFSESFEVPIFVGYESAKLTLDVCPDGSTSAAIDIAPCEEGS